MQGESIKPPVIIELDDEFHDEFHFIPVDTRPTRSELLENDIPLKNKPIEGYFEGYPKEEGALTASAHKVFELKKKGSRNKSHY